MCAVAARFGLSDNERIESLNNKNNGNHRNEMKATIDIHGSKDIHSKKTNKDFRVLWGMDTENLSQIVELLDNGTSGLGQCQKGDQVQVDVREISEYNGKITLFGSYVIIAGAQRTPSLPIVPNGSVPGMRQKLREAAQA